MPIYEYLCTECDREFETLVSAAKAEQTSCPACGAAHPRRLMSVIAGMAGRSSSGSMAGPVPSGPACGAGACARCS